MNFDVKLRIVKVQHKDWQFHDFKIENDVPEYCSVLSQKGIPENDLLTFLFHDIDVFLI